MNESDHRSIYHEVVMYEPSDQVIDEFEGEHVFKKFNNIQLYEQESITYRNDFAQ